MSNRAFEIYEGRGPLVATCIHDGHEIRESLQKFVALNDAERLREEDPFTEPWTHVAPTRVVVRTSRFEVDINRPRERAVYQVPEDAWGLTVWKDPLPDAEVEASLQLYDRFYAELKALLDRIVSQHGRFVVFDIHSFNHRRDGPDAPPQSPDENPELNLGTASIDRAIWGPLVDRFVSELSTQDVSGRTLDIRQNVKFTGGNMSRWIHKTFPETGCSLAIELKKFFMDEWTGELFEEEHQSIQKALGAVVPAVLEELGKLG